MADTSSQDSVYPEEEEVEDEEDDDNVSSVSEISGLSDLSGQEWKPMAGSIMRVSWRLIGFEKVKKHNIINCLFYLLFRYKNRCKME